MNPCQTFVVFFSQLGSILPACGKVIPSKTAPGTATEPDFTKVNTKGLVRVSLEFMVFGLEAFSSLRFRSS